MRVLVLVCTPLPGVTTPGHTRRHCTQRDQHLFRDVTTRHPARPRGASAVPGRALPDLTRDVTATEVTPGPSLAAGDRAGPRRPRGRERRPQRRGARGQRGRGGGRRVARRLLHVGALNIQSLKPKLLELSDVLHRHDIDVMLLSETWLRPTTPSRLVVLPGYTISRVDRPDRRGYGGVATITRTGVTSSTLKIPSSGNAASKLESQWTLLKLERGRQVVIGSVYRPPRYTVAALQDDFTDLETQLQRVMIDSPGTPLLICGDLNCDWLKAPSDPARRRLEEFVSDHSLNPRPGGGLSHLRHGGGGGAK